VAETVVHAVAAGDRRLDGDASGGRSAPGRTTRSRRTFERRAMGSRLRLTVTGATPGAALLAWGRVSDEFERAEQAMSRFRESSDLTRVNRAASPGGTVVPIEVDARLRRALVAARRAQRLTNGRFDPRVLRDLERLEYRGAPLVDRPDDDAARRPEATRWLTVARRAAAAVAVAVDDPVDLGGIGKGLALRWAWRRLWAGLTMLEGAGALLEAGGDLVATGPSPDGGPWIIGIEDPGSRLAGSGGADIGSGGADIGSGGADIGSESGDRPHIAAIAVEHGAVCTSSVAVHRWRDLRGRLVHHLVDPATGEPGGAGLLSVTVAGGDPAWAEVWSKTLFLEGARGIADAARRRGLAAWWVTESGSLEMTPGARLRTAWTSQA
jgi:thiamine biosynthesis lipoprotein